VECTFGFHAWLAAWFVPSSEMPAFVALVEDLLENRGDPLSVGGWADVYTFSVPESSQAVFRENCLRMLSSV
jgi:hypothetical protein